MKCNIPENVYRLSRIQRVLGNPTASGILDILLRRGASTPTAIAAELKASLPNVSQTLNKMRLAEIVRYSRERGGVRYDLKYAKEVRDYVMAGMRFVGRAARRIEEDR